MKQTTFSSLAWSGYCGSTSCRSGSISRIPRPRTRCTTSSRCAVLRESSWRAAIPDESTILRFRHLLEASAGRTALCRRALEPGEAAPVAQGWHDRRCDDHCRPAFDQERRPIAHHLCTGELVPAQKTLGTGVRDVSMKSAKTEKITRRPSKVRSLEGIFLASS